MKFDLSAAWNDTIAMVKQFGALIFPIIGVFAFLPSLVFALAIPAFAPTPGAGSDAALSEVTEYFASAAPYFIAITIFSLISTLAILSLILSEEKPTVGDALKLALVFLLSGIAAQILTGLMMIAGLMLLIVPALYLAGRLSVVYAAMMAEHIKNPIQAIKRSWQLTENNGWRIFLFMFMVAVIATIIQMIIAAFLGAIAGLLVSLEAAETITIVVTSFLGAIAAGLYTIMGAAVYRQITGPSTGTLRQTFG